MTATGQAGHSQSSNRPKFVEAGAHGGGGECGHSNNRGRGRTQRRKKKNRQFRILCNESLVFSRTIDAILAVMSTMIYTWSKAHVRLMSFL